MMSAEYLSGIVDGEGCVYFTPERREWGIVISNTDPGIIEGVEHSLTLLGVHHTKHYARKQEAHHKELTRICISSKDSLLQLAENLNLRSEKKRAKLKAIQEYHRGR
jgi:intein-encoded DNA endonuclease-like protein